MGTVREWIAEGLCRSECSICWFGLLAAVALELGEFACAPEIAEPDFGLRPQK